MRICSNCGSEYEHYGQRCSLCRDCKRVYDREYHHKRPMSVKAKKIKRQADRIRENQQKVYEYLQEHPCEHCGESDPVVLEFDHLDRSTKVGNVADMVKSGASMNTIMGEINKCRVLCANCHRRHTAAQLGWKIYGV